VIERREQWMLAVIFCALAAFATLRPLPASRPQRIPISVATPWMADCLPGVGRTRRDAAANALRARRFDVLPPSAREHVGDLFAIDR